MTSRPRWYAAQLWSWRLCSRSPATPVAAQLIQIKTLPIADGDQWRFFPSANQGLGGVSIALRDSLLDPFDNPAKGARLSDRTKGIFFGSPTAYSVSQNAGGGMTLPIGGIVRSGSTFGGLAVAIQEIDAAQTQQGFFPPTVDIVRQDGTPAPAPTNPSRQNRFAFGTLGRTFERAGISVGASALWSGLNDVDGVDLLYAGSAGIDQHGSALDVRLGFLKEWTGQRSFEAIVLHDRFGMTHDVTWLDQVWDPNTRTIKSQARMDHNLDRTNTWGLHLGYSQPLAASGWHVGAIVTTNLMSHPKLPDYQITQVMVIPWDPGHSAAYDLGVGIAKSAGLTTFGVDAIYEPIRTQRGGNTHADRDPTGHDSSRRQDDRKSFPLLECDPPHGNRAGDSDRHAARHHKIHSPRARPRTSLHRLHARSVRSRNAGGAKRSTELDRVDADLGTRSSVQRPRAPLHGTQDDRHRPARHHQQRRRHSRRCSGRLPRGPEFSLRAERSDDADECRGDHASDLRLRTDSLIEATAMTTRRHLVGACFALVGLSAAACVDGTVGVTPPPTGARSLDEQVRASISGWGVVPILPVNAQDPVLVDLGKSLFFDKILSGNRDVSCATCHSPLANSGDAQSLAVGTGAVLANGTAHPRHRTSIHASQCAVPIQLSARELLHLLGRPAVGATRPGSLSDANGSNLPSGLSGLVAAQAMVPVTNRIEMRGSAGDRDVAGALNEIAQIPDGQNSAIWDAAMRRVLAIAAYQQKFNAAFPGVPASQLGFQHAANAIAAFEAQTFTKSNSAFDRYLARDDNALSTEAKRGASSFSEKRSAPRATTEHCSAHRASRTPACRSSVRAPEARRRSTPGARISSAA